MCYVSNGETKDCVKSVGTELLKCLGILEADKFLEEKMKLNISKKYIRRLRKVLKSKLNGVNLGRGVNN